MKKLALVVTLTVGAFKAVHAAEFFCPPGDVTCMIAAINKANVNGQLKNTIRLAADTYTLTTVDNNVDGPNSLPSITSTLTIRGAGAQTTIIERDPIISLFQEPMFRIVHWAWAAISRSKDTQGLILSCQTVNSAAVY
jgi:hypothetical protein